VLSSQGATPTLDQGRELDLMIFRIIAPAAHQDVEPCL
jgi:hypothetical protein